MLKTQTEDKLSPAMNKKKHEQLLLLATAVLKNIVKKMCPFRQYDDRHCKLKTTMLTELKLPNYSNRRSTRFILSCFIVSLFALKKKQKKNEHRNGNNRCGHRWLHNKTTIPNNVNFKRNYEIFHTFIAFDLFMFFRYSLHFKTCRMPSKINAVVTSNKLLTNEFQFYGI